METTKTCPRCTLTLPVGEFYKNRGRRDGLSPYCVPCARSADKESILRLKREAFKFLGEVCAQCGFADERALQIDHPNGGGRKDRQGKSTNQFYRSVLASPKGTFTLLCANCNWIKRIENEEHGARIYVREIPTERILPPHALSLPEGKWTRKHDACIECGTTERKHASKGLCVNCYMRKRSVAAKP